MANRRRAGALVPFEGPGRDTKYTPETLRIIKEKLEGGCTRKDAGIFAGIGQQTFARWLNGELPDQALAGLKTPEEIAEKKSEFCKLVEAAEAVWREGLVATVKLHSVKDARHAEFLLQRHPNSRGEWAEKIIISPDDDAGSKQFSEEQVARIEEAILKTGRARRRKTDA